MKTYVIVHGGCFDGYGAAWVAHKALGDAATYIHHFHGEPVPVVEDGSLVLMFDIALKPEALIMLRNRGCSVLVKDHHQTAMNDCKGRGVVEVIGSDGKLVERVCDACGGSGRFGEVGCAKCGGIDFAYFDMTHSGAMLAWMHFFPGQEAPDLVKWIEDKDLWKFNYKETEPAMAALRAHKSDFAVWDELAANPQQLVVEGRVALALTGEVVDRIVGGARLTPICGHVVPVVNATAHWSEVGHALLTKYPGHPFSASYYDAADGRRRWSLRSRPDFDVSVIATHFGGGGHKQAAGFTTEAPPPL